MPDTPLLRPSSVLAAFLEPVVEGRRVIVFGEATSRLCENLLDRGARLVHVCDPDTVRVATAAARNTSQSVSFAPLAESGLSVREGAFDVGIIEDMAALTALPPALALRQLSRALALHAVAAVAAPNPSAASRLLGARRDGSSIDYYQLFDLVSSQFDEVRMFGQMPFVGYSMAAFGLEGEVEPSLDNAYLPGGAEEPEWFLAVAGSRVEMLEGFQVVQLPAELVARGDRAGHLREIGAARAAESAALERLAEAEALCIRMQEAERARAREPRWADRVKELERELEKREKWLAALEGRAETADMRADEVQERLDVVNQELERLLELAARTLDGSQEAELEADDEGLERDAQQLVAQLESRLSVAASRIRDLERARESSEQHRQAAEQARNEAAQKLRELEAALGAARGVAASSKEEAVVLREEQAALDARVRELEERLRNAAAESASELSAELGRLEEQLVERGQHVRTLEADMREAERFARELLLELDELKVVSSPATDSPGWSVPLEEAGADAWTRETRQGDGCGEPWVEARLGEQQVRPFGVGPAPEAAALAQPESPRGGSPGDSTDPGREAELVAELQMARWAVDKLQAELESAKVAVAGCLELEKALEQARGEVLRQAAVIEQLESRSPS